MAQPNLPGVGTSSDSDTQNTPPALLATLREGRGDPAELRGMLLRDFRGLPGGDAVNQAAAALRAELDRTIDWAAVGADFGEVAGEKLPTPSDIGKRFEQLLADVVALPQGKGDAMPEPGSLLATETALESSRHTFDFIAEDLFAMMEREGRSSAAEYYTGGFRIFDEARAKLIWEKLNADPRLHELLELLSYELAESLPSDVKGDHLETARDEIRRYLTNLSPSHIEKTKPSYLLLLKIKRALDRAYMVTIKEAVICRDLPLVPGDEALEDTAPFCAALEAALLFEDLADQAHVDMISNTLGQAQTANIDKAETFFRNHEGVAGENIQNNFGYVYLNGAQAEAMGIQAQDTGVSAFTYYNEPYLAVPIGWYWANKSGESFSLACQELTRLERTYRDTPAAEYYSALLEYYAFPSLHRELQGEAFTKGYYQACYDAEQKWVAYVKYAAEAKLPFIHIHPFERYQTRSTKSHDLPLGIVNPAEAQELAEEKDAYLRRVGAFLKQSGIANAFPAMDTETIRLIEHSAAIALAARFGTATAGTLASNVPNEDAGKTNGIGVLHDTLFTKGLFKTVYLDIMHRIDPIGELAAQFEVDGADEERVMRFIKNWVEHHELTHNLFKGKQAVFSGDGRGLAVNAVEEAKATTGMGLKFENPDALTSDELENLRSTVLFVVFFMFRRLRKNMRAEHKTQEYLREGMVMLDHALKSGLVEVVGVRFNAELEAQKVGVDELDTADLVFPRLNFGDGTLQAFIRKCVGFLRDLASIYAQSQGYAPLPPDGIIPDITSIDAWQEVSGVCHDESIQAEREKEGGGDVHTIHALQAAQSKIAPPQHPEIAQQARALIRYVDEQNLATIIAAKLNLAEDDPEVARKTAELQAQLVAQFPQIHYDFARFPSPAAAEAAATQTDSALPLSPRFRRPE